MAFALCEFGRRSFRNMAKRSRDPFRKRDHAERKSVSPKAVSGTGLGERSLTNVAGNWARSCTLDFGSVPGLKEIASSREYPKRSVLFTEGQPARGIFLVSKGRVKLSASSVGGRTFVLCIAGGGEVIGLPTTIARHPYYEMSAETLDRSQLQFIPSYKFLQFVHRRNEAAFRAAEVLSQMYLSACRDVRSLGLSRTSIEKLARFLLEVTLDRSCRDAPAHSSVSCTHAEIAERIGVSRETVTRGLAILKGRQLVGIRHSRIDVINRSGLFALLDA